MKKENGDKDRTSSFDMKWYGNKMIAAACIYDGWSVAQFFFKSITILTKCDVSS